MISAVDLIKGIAICAGMRSIDVPGANGNYDTNYDGKANAAISALRDGYDLVYVHLEGPDECGHQGNADHKKLAVERIDEKIIAPIRAAMKEDGERYKMLVLPDHPTPVALKTHVSDPIPYLIYDSEKPKQTKLAYTEKNAEKTGVFVPLGHELMKHFLED